MEGIRLNPSFLQKATFSWIIPIIVYYKNNKPSFSNLLNVSHQADYENSTQQLKKNFKSQPEQKPGNFLKAIIETFYKDFLYDIFLSVLSLALMLLDSVLIYYMILYIKHENKPLTEGILLAVAIIIESLVMISVSTYSTMACMLFSTKLKRIMVCLVSEKCLNMHGSEISKKNTRGKCFNLITGDLVIIDGLSQVIMFFAIMIAFIITFVLAGAFFGGWGVFAIAFSFLHIPVMLAIGNSTKEDSSKVFAISDKRIKLIEKLIEGIQIIKLYAWEFPYLKRIYDEKQKESDLQRSLLNINLLFIVLGHAGCILVIFTTLSFYTLTEGELISSEVFFLVGVIIMSQGLWLILSVIGIKSLFDILQIFERLEELLFIREATKNSHNLDDIKRISLNNAEFSWESDENIDKSMDSEKFDTSGISSVGNLTVNIKNNGLIIVVGPSGSAKTTLLMGLLGELFLISGECIVNGSIAFASEEPWLTPDTLKENITKGREFNDARYQKVLESCDLLKDLKMLPNGDETMVGDRGITLSGGQKSRICLARALYADHDILLLDDPLSAVDVTVGNHLFATIKDLSQEKIVVLVTHQLHYLAEADQVIVVNNGLQVFCGSTAELTDRADIQSLLGTVALSYAKKDSDLNEDEYKQKDVATISEDQSEITVNFQTYFKYTLLGVKSKILLIAILFLMLLSQFVISLAYYWVALWIESDESEYNYYIAGLAIICFSAYVTFSMRTYPICNLLVNSNRILHNTALEGLTTTNSGYFDTNSSGVLINRFCKDSASLDNLLIIYYYESLSLAISSNWNCNHYFYHNSILTASASNTCDNALPAVQLHQLSGDPGPKNGNNNEGPTAHLLQLNPLRICYN